MEKIKFSVNKRQLDQQVAKLRRQGLLLANMYQAGKDSIALQFDAGAFAKLHKKLERGLEFKRYHTPEQKRRWFKEEPWFFLFFSFFFLFFHDDKMNFLNFMRTPEKKSENKDFKKTNNSE